MSQYIYAGGVFKTKEGERAYVAAADINDPHTFYGCVNNHLGQQLVRWNMHGETIDQNMHVTADEQYWLLTPNQEAVIELAKLDRTSLQIVKAIVVAHPTKKIEAIRLIRAYTKWTLTVTKAVQEYLALQIAEEQIDAA